MEEELADAAKEADDVAVAEGMAFLVANSFQELVDPDRSVDGETLPREGFELDGACAGLDDGPEARDAHGGGLLGGGCVRGVIVMVEVGRGREVLTA